MAPEQRSCIDDALDQMLNPAELVCESNLKFIRERSRQNIPRKYVYYGPLGQDVVNRPVVHVMETWHKAEEPNAAYERRKDEEAWVALVMELKRRVLCGELLPREGKKYWQSVLMGPKVCMAHKQKTHVYEVQGETYRVKPSSREEEAEEVLQKVMAKQRARTFYTQGLPKMLYREERSEDESAPEPAMERDFLRDERGEQLADFSSI